MKVYNNNNIDLYNTGVNAPACQ